MPEFDPKSIPILDDIIENETVEMPPVPVENPAYNPGENASDDSDDITVDTTTVGEETFTGFHDAENTVETEDDIAAFSADNSIPELNDEAIPLTASEPLEDELVFEEDVIIASETLLTESETAQTGDSENSPPFGDLASTGIDYSDIDNGNFADLDNENNTEEIAPESALINDSSGENSPEPELSAETGTETQPEPDTTPATDTTFEQAAGDSDSTDKEVFTDNETGTAAAATPFNTEVLLKPVIDDVVRHLLPDLEQQMRFLIQQALEERLPEEILAQLAQAEEKHDKD